MLNLMKYELFRRTRLLITTLIIFFFLELMVFVGMKLGGGWYIMSVFAFILLIVGGISFPFLDAVINYFSDFKKKNGYMMFLTPNNGYSILGSKVLFLLIEFAIMAVLLAGAVKIDYDALYKIAPEVLGEIFGEMTIGLKMLFGTTDLGFINFLPLITVVLMQYMTNAMVALFSITVAKTLLSNKDFNWLLALVFYIGIYTVIQMVYGVALLAFGLVQDTIVLSETENLNSIQMLKYLFVGMGLYAAVFGTLFPLSGNLLNKRTDL